MTRRVRGVLAAATTMVVGGVAMSTSMGTADADPPSSSTSSAVAADSFSAADSVAEPRSTQAGANEVTDLDLPAGVSVALVDLDDGDTVTVGAAEQYDTASIVKVDIIAALLWQHDGVLTTAQQQWASAAIEYSDNASATRLYEAIGGKAGLDAFNAQVGLTSTVAGADGDWGLTQTTVTDQITLLQVVFGHDSVLDEASQGWLGGLMGHVVDTQDFGVDAAADDPEKAALKVGYLQRSATALWDVTSIGRVERGGHTLLIAVLSEDQASFESGKAAIESAVESAAASVD